MKPHLSNLFFLALSFAVVTHLECEAASPAASYPIWNVQAGSFAISGPGGALAAGSEITQRVEGDIAGVRLVARPTFESAPKSWAMVSVGGATLTFGRDGKVGGLILTGDAMSPLDVSIPLDAAGRAQETVDVTLLVDRVRGVAEVTLVGGPSYATKLTMVSGPIQIVVSSGASSAMSIERLEVLSAPVATVAGNTAKPANATSATGTAAKPDKAESSEADLRKAAFDEAMQLLREKKWADAETKVTAPSKHAAKSFEWYAETAGNLTYLALALRQEYDPRGAIDVGKRVLALLAEADKLPGRPEAAARAALFEMAGFVQEEILRDDDEAEKAYTQAAQINDKAERVNEALARLKNKKSRGEPASGK